MPTLGEHHASEVVKMEALGDSGSGKTGALASLVNELDLDLWILDYDNGLDILHTYVDPAKLDKVHYWTLTDKLNPNTKGPIPVGVPKAFSKGMQLLQDWKEPDGTSHGSIYTRGPGDVIVLDSGTTFGKAAMNYTMALNNRLGEHPWPGDWGEAMGRMEGLFELFFADSVKCHIIVTFHIQHSTRKVETTDREGNTKITEVESDHGFPTALGNKLPPKIARYFNTVVKFERRGRTEGRIKTLADDEVDLKNAAPKKVPKEVPLGTGMATIFKSLMASASHEEKK